VFGLREINNQGINLKLRSYQSQIVESVFNEWANGVRSTLVVVPTGGGKTIIFADIVQKMQPKRALILAHREELIWQARDKIEKVTGLKAEIEMGQYKASMNGSLFHPQAKVVIATVQTLSSGGDGGGRMTKFNPLDFGLLIIDECFPAGTLVDGVPIEKIKIGDTVKTHKGAGIVKHIFKNPVPDIMLKIKFLDGSEITCTENHPIWTPNGFVPAKDLTLKSMVLTITLNEKMHHLWDGNKKQTVQEQGVQVCPLQKHDSKDIRRSRRSNNKLPKNKWNEPTGSSGISVSQAKGNEMETDCARRKWAINNSPNSIGECAWLGNGIGNKNIASKKFRLSDVLQGGYWEQRIKDWNRRGRKQPQYHNWKNERREKGFFPAFIGVDSIEIQKFGSGKGCSKVCSDGYVYNLEVENGNTYFANGILVHNCHHGTGQSYKKVINYFLENNPELVVLGVTATPDRADEEALGQIFETVPDTQVVEILDLINQGWLVPIFQQMVHVESINFESVRTTAGDLNGADLDAVMMSEKNLHGVASSTIDIVGDRRGIGFASSVNHARILSDIFNRHRSGMANWICGKTDKMERKKILSDFAAGKIQWVWNCGVLTEGFDDSGVEIISMARPTKSRSLYSQMAGRSTRPHETIAHKLNDCPSAGIRKGMILRSCKPSALIIDFVGNSGKHKLMTTADILGGKYSDEAVKETIELAKREGRAMRMDKSIEEQEELLAKKKERDLQERARKQKLILNATYKTQLVDPFDILDIKPVTPRGYESNKPLTENMSKFLREKMGLNPDNFTFTQAGQLIGEQKRRWDQGLCSLKQAKWLKKNGYDSNVKFKDASAIMTAWANNGWKRPPSNQLPPSVAGENKIEVPREWETAGGIVDSENPF
jgi:superfamily II DNA or RNA helicase